MITAKEAHEKAAEFYSDEVKNELDICGKEIATAIGKGEMSCSVLCYLRPQTRDKLSKLGYEVKDFSSQKEGYTFLISW